MTNLYVLCGLPGSGKSTWAKNFLKENPETIIVSRDKIRFSLLKEGDDYFSRENEVIQQYYSQINEKLADLTIKNVIADATHLTIKTRNKLLCNLKLHNVNIIMVNFLIDYRECIKRNQLREGFYRVPDIAMENAFNSFRAAEMYENTAFKYNEIINIVS